MSFYCIKHNWANPVYACPVCHPAQIAVSNTSASFKEYGHKSVVEALHELHVALEINYFRNGLQVSLEPDAFYRLALELYGKHIASSPTPEQLQAKSIETYTPAGKLVILRDDSLGENHYRGTNE